MKRRKREFPLDVDGMEYSRRDVVNIIRHHRELLADIADLKQQIERAEHPKIAIIESDQLGS